jgi:hypothetical protein
MAALCSVRRAGTGKRSTRDNKSPSIDDGTSTVSVAGAQRHPLALRVSTPSEISPTFSDFRG